MHERDKESKTKDSTITENKKRKKKKKNVKPENFDIDLSRSDPQKRTTVMLKNIPNKYTKKMLLKEIEKKFAGAFDFFYLPIDFTNNCNMGYSFINFKDHQILRDFCQVFDGKKWRKFKSDKICSVKYARI